MGKPQHILSKVFNNDNSSGVALKNKILKGLIFKFLDQTESASINEISKEINISVPKTTSLITELIEEGLISDYGKFESTGGRKANLYGLIGDAGFILGVDVKKFYINIGLLNFKKQLIHQKSRITFKLDNTAESLNQLIQIIQNFIKEVGIKKDKILSLGINLSGRINHTKGHSYTFFHFQEEPLSEIIQEKIGIKTYLENDSRAMAFGEFCNGEVNTEKNVLFVNLDYGIGLGILIDGKVYYGKSGFSGEFGHIPFFNNEIICHCGKKGCLETEASGNALLRKFKEKIKLGSTSSVLKKNKKVEDITLTDLIQAAQKEDVLIIELLAELGENLGKGLAVLINVFNPELIIIGGTLSETGEYLKLPIKSSINKYSLSLVNADTELKLSKLGEKAGIIGACLLAKNKALSVI
jgi:hypothetical protein